MSDWLSNEEKFQDRIEIVGYFTSIISIILLLSYFLLVILVLLSSSLISYRVALTLII